MCVCRLVCVILSVGVCMSVHMCDERVYKGFSCTGDYKLYSLDLTKQRTLL